VHAPPSARPARSSAKPQVQECRYRATDTSGARQKVVVRVTAKTKKIANGITARVIRDSVTEKGERRDAAAARRSRRDADDRAVYHLAAQSPIETCICASPSQRRLPPPSDVSHIRASRTPPGGDQQPIQG